MVTEMISVGVLPAELSAMTPLVIISVKNPNCFNELRILGAAEKKEGGDYKIRFKTKYPLLIVSKLFPRSC